MHAMFGQGLDMGLYVVGDSMHLSGIHPLYTRALFQDLHEVQRECDCHSAMVMWLEKPPEVVCVDLFACKLRLCLALLYCIPPASSSSL